MPVVMESEVWFVMPKYEELRDCPALLNPIYAVLLPQDLPMFRIRDDGEPVFKYHGRWREVLATWRQLTREGQDPADNRPCVPASFAKYVLAPMGAAKWVAVTRNKKENKK